MPDGKILLPGLPVQALGSAQAHLQGCAPAWRHHPGAGPGLYAQLDLGHTVLQRYWLRDRMIEKGAFQATD